jgi:hypothetical protein
LLFCALRWSLLCCADFRSEGIPGTSRFHYFLHGNCFPFLVQPLPGRQREIEGNKLDQGRRLSVDFKVEVYEDFRSDGIEPGRSKAAASIIVCQQSSESDIELYEHKDLPIPTDAAECAPNRERQGNP